jgi:signal transduction histidine kinase/ligand-binding sensor domain-containing protein
VKIDNRIRLFVILICFLGSTNINVVFSQGKILYFSHLTAENGLSQNTIHGIVQDKYGFMWFGTWSGVCKYDGYKFIIYRNDPDKQNSIINNRIHYIYKDLDESIWLTSFDSTYYCRYNYETDDFTRILRKDVPQRLRDSLNRHTNFSRYNVRFKNFTWNVDQETNLLYQTNRSTGKKIVYRSDLFNKWALNDDYVTDLYVDNNENLWVGTYSGGINKASLNSAPFIYYHHSPNSQNTLISNNIRGIAEDKQGNIWVGTRSNGITIINREKNVYSTLIHNSLNKNSLVSNQIRKIYCDLYGQIWIGTKDGLDRYDSEKKMFFHYSLHPGKRHIPHNWVYSLYEDHNNNLWAGSWNGLLKYNREKDEFYSYSSSNILLYPYIRVILEDRKLKNLWIATEGGGLTKLIRDPSSGFKEKLTPKHYLNKPDNPNSLLNDRIYAMQEDKKGFIWIGTGGGLCRFDPINEKFIRFSIKNGLPDDMIMGLLIDNIDNIWVSHKKGITRINPNNFQMQSFSFEDGLQGNEFNEDAYFKSKNGELFFGGLNGLNSFFPEKISHNFYPPQIVFTNLYLFNKPVIVNQEVNNRIVLKKPMFLTDKIEILNSDKSFSIEIAALHYLNPNGNQYKYRLEGFDNDWIYAGADKRIVTYTNLKPAKYIFKVLASNCEGVWTSVPKTLTIIVQPAWWGTWWFRFIIFVFILGVIYGVYYLRVAIYRTKERDLSILVEQRTRELKEINELLLERQKHIEEQANELQFRSENLKETNALLLDKQKLIQQQANKLEETNHELSILNATKDKFFSIIAHDLRNPFHTVMGFSELLMLSFEKISQDKIRKYIQLIHTSSVAGNNLLENLLQWSRSQTGKMTFEPVAIDILKLVLETNSLFEISMQRKNITIKNQIDPDTFVFADPNMLQTIIRNLLSNAIKFSNENGEIIISVKQTELDVVISIADNGIGIPLERQDKLLNKNFSFSTPGTKNETGTGLGLVLCKEFVEKHGGKIWFESEPGKGCTFTFTLPQNH